MGKTGEKAGMAAAVEAKAVGVPASEEAVQLTLDAIVPAPVFDGEEGEVLDGAPRGPGRPPGSANKATLARADWLDRQYTNPLETLARITHVDPFDLMRRLKAEFDIEPERVLSFWKECALAQLPYRNKKQPVAVDLGGKGSFQLVISDLAPDQQDNPLAQLAGVGIEHDDEKIAENSQKLIEHEQKSHDQKSHGVAKPLENNDK